MFSASPTIALFSDGFMEKGEKYGTQVLLHTAGMCANATVRLLKSITYMLLGWLCRHPSGDARIALQSQQIGMNEARQSALLGMNLEELKSLAEEFAQPAYRASQLFEAIY